MILWILAIFMIMAFIYLLMFRPERQVQSVFKHQTLEDLATAFSIYMRDRLYMQKRKIVSHEQFINENEEKQLLRKTLEKAIGGDYPSRLVIIDEIQAFLIGTSMNIETLDDLNCILFRSPDAMSATEKFETMMYYLKKEVQSSMTVEQTYDEDNDDLLKIFKKFVEFTGVFKEKRPLKTDSTLSGYYLNDRDLSYHFRRFMDDKQIEITVADAVSITSILIYQRLFGFDIVDTLTYDNSIDEIEIGTTGATVGSGRHISSPLNSILIAMSNRLLRLQFLSFRSEAAYKNCIIALAANGEKTFTEDDGLKYTTLHNLRRITARRPPAADKISVNIRRLSFAPVTNRQLLEMNPVVPGNVQLVQDTLQVMAWTMTTFCWTGEQGSGKTSHVNAFCNLLDADTAIRALGNIDESQFGNRYPERDAQHLFETPRQSLHQIAGMARRTRGTFLILMEVIDAESGQEAINNFKSGYIGGMMTGHGATTEAMIEFMAQLLAMGQATSTVETTKIVANVLRLNVKTAKYGTTFHYEAITEIIPRDWNVNWEKIHVDNEHLAAYADRDESIERIRAYNEQLYFQNSLNPQLYATQTLIRFNKESLTYEAVHRPSLKLCVDWFFAIAPSRRKFLFDYLEYYFKVDLAEELIEGKHVFVSSKEELLKFGA